MFWEHLRVPKELWFKVGLHESNVLTAQTRKTK